MDEDGGDELADVVVDDAAFLDGGDDRSEVSSVSTIVAAARATAVSETPIANADVGAPERRRVVDAITARAQMRQQHVDPLLRINDADTQMRSARPPAQDRSRGDRAGHAVG